MLAPPDPTNTPLPPPSLESLPPTPPLFLSQPPLSSLTVSCLLSLTPRGRATPGPRPSNLSSKHLWYNRPDPPPREGAGLRPRGVGINCLVALKGEAWLYELL